ncbi:MAG: alpha/beta fold hydrolase [Pseudomonadota bacterium]
MTSERARARLGPTPLPAQVMTVAGSWVGAAAAYQAAIAGTLPWHDAVADKAAKLMDAIRAADMAAVGQAVAQGAQDRLAAFIAGVEAYQRHPYRRALTAPPALAQVGSARLLDYGARTRTRARRPVAVFVPSLVNPATVLDLSGEASLMRYLARRGVRPLLIDWGCPDDEERGFDITAYVTRRLIPLLEAARARRGTPITLVGYCMGGNLALAASLLRPDLVARLALLATPWDFHAAGMAAPHLMTALAASLEPVMAAQGVLPAECLQLVFAALDPLLIDRKFRRFATLDPESAAARAFVALEDWSNSGPPLAAPVAREVFAAWYRDNAPGQNRWRVADATIDPARLAVPSLVVLPAGDRIVPPACAGALAARLPGAQRLSPKAGHVGMIVGARGKTSLWRPLAAWLKV